MARKLEHADCFLETIQASDDFMSVKQSDMFGLIQEGDPWWQTPPHFFDAWEFEALLKPERADAARKR